MTSDFNTATEEEDGYEEGHVSDNTAIISMPTLTEEVLEEQGTKGTGLLNAFMLGYPYAFCVKFYHFEAKITTIRLAVKTYDLKKIW